MTKIACPLKCDHGYHLSSGDGWEEWDECRCCNPAGDNDSGRVSRRSVAAWKKAEAAEEKRVDAQIREWEAKMSQPCPKCGVPLIDHYSREGEPCKSIEQANKEFAAAKEAAKQLSQRGD